MLKLLVLAHDPPEEVFETWHGGLLGRFISRGCLLCRLISSGGLSTTQAAVVVKLRVAVGVGQDDAILAGLRGLNVGG